MLLHTRPTIDLTISYWEINAAIMPNMQVHRNPFHRMYFNSVVTPASHLFYST